MFNMDSDEQKTDFWRSMEKRRKAYYKAATLSVSKYFKKDRKAVVKAYRAGGLKAALKAVDDNTEHLAKVIESINNVVVKEFGEATFSQLKNEAEEMEIKLFGGVFDFFDKIIKGWIEKNVAEKVVLITDTTKSQIKTVVETGDELGESIDKIAKRIDDLYLDQIIPNRSTVIARTEVISSSNAGNHLAAKQTGLKLEKEWISTRDERTRGNKKSDKYNHLVMDGVKVDMDEPYDVPMKDGKTEPLMFPGDPAGSAANVIQCRCTEGYAVKK